MDIPSVLNLSQTSIIIIIVIIIAIYIYYNWSKKAQKKDEPEDSADKILDKLEETGAVVEDKTQ